MIIGSRTTIDFIRAGKLLGFENEKQHLYESNGVRPMFGRCWWFWLPNLRIQKNGGYIPSIDLSWLCWMITIMFWPYSIKQRSRK